MFILFKRKTSLSRKYKKMDYNQIYLIMSKPICLCLVTCLLGFWFGHFVLTVVLKFVSAFAWLKVFVALIGVLFRIIPT